MNESPTENIQRYSPSNDCGLSTAQVQERISQGLTNSDKSNSTKSISAIIKSNLFTLFNLIYRFL